MVLPAGKGRRGNPVRGRGFGSYPSRGISILRLASIAFRLYVPGRFKAVTLFSSMMPSCGRFARMVSERYAGLICA